MFYILLLLRIAIPFELNKCIIYSLSFIIAISAVTSMIYIVLLFFIYNDQYLVWRIVSGILLGDSLLFSIFVIGIFVRKMKKTVSNIDPSTSLLAAKNVNLIRHTVVKSGLLFGIGIIVNPGYLLCIILNTYFGGSETFTANMNIIGTQVLEATVVVVILWLILRANYAKYMRLCRCCHICVTKCCFKTANMEELIVNPYEAIEETEITQSTNPVAK